METRGRLRWLVEKHLDSQIQSEEKWLGHLPSFPRLLYLMERDMLDQSICFRVGNGEIISFWHAVWVGESLLALQFPDLYRCARNCNAKVKDYLHNDPNSSQWWLIFRRNLN